MITRQGDVFTTDAFWIGHGCNIRGVMGAGVAKTVKQRYPVTYDAYVKQCMGGNFQPGDAFGVYEHKKIIVNLATQDEPGRNARYEWVFASALKAAQRIADGGYWKDKPKVMAVPQIGAGIGGLEWPKVQTLLEAVEVLVPGFQFEVWEYKP